MSFMRAWFWSFHKKVVLFLEKCVILSLTEVKNKFRMKKIRIYWKTESR